MQAIVSASILSADLCNLEKDIKNAEKSGCEYIHFDVMDGVFVDNISYGVPVLKSVSKVCKSILDVHLMIINPLKYVKDFAESGADIITFHLEANSDVVETINAIKSFNKKVGISIKPNTPIEAVIPYINDIDMILVMTVEPGFGGQGFIYETLDKIEKLSEYKKSHNISIPIQVDGGINAETGRLVKDAGANILVAGSYIFNSKNMDDAVNSLR